MTEVPPAETESAGRRGRRGAGVLVNPERVRQARIDCGLSLAELAAGEVSRAFIHQVEHGLARPSIKVLRMIADRTDKPVEYFTDGRKPIPRDLPGELVTAARRVDRLRVDLEGDLATQEALRMVVNTLRHSARVVAAVTSVAAPQDEAEESQEE